MRPEVRRLIEDMLPIAAINEVASSEKVGGRLGHPSTLHLWWAPPAAGGNAGGDESYASVLAGLFRDVSLSDMIDRAVRLPPGVQGVAFVEGVTDDIYLRLAAKLAGRPDLVEGLHIVPTGGAYKMIVEAILIRRRPPCPSLPCSTTT